MTPNFGKIRKRNSSVRVWFNGQKNTSDADKFPLAWRYSRPFSPFAVQTCFKGTVDILLSLSGGGEACFASLGGVSLILLLCFLYFMCARTYVSDTGFTFTFILFPFTCAMFGCFVKSLLVKRGGHVPPFSLKKDLFHVYKKIPARLKKSFFKKVNIYNKIN